MEITAYNDKHTADRFGAATTFACLAVADGAAMGAGLRSVADGGFRIVRAKLLDGGASAALAATLFAGGPTGGVGRICALELAGLGDVSAVGDKWRKFVAARGGGGAFYAPADAAASTAEANAVFGTGRVPQTGYVSSASDASSDVTCIVVKPHAIHEGRLGLVVQRCAEAGLTVDALEAFVLDKTQAAEFLDVYKGVSPVYVDMVNELSNGPCVALALRKAGGGAVAAARALVGPHEFAYV
jgi:nucleoside diphosphate kinase